MVQVSQSAPRSLSRRNSYVEYVPSRLRRSSTNEDLGSKARRHTYNAEAAELLKGRSGELHAI